MAVGANVAASARAGGAGSSAAVGAATTRRAMEDVRRRLSGVQARWGCWAGRGGVGYLGYCRERWGLLHQTWRAVPVQ
jgi:hypothetical protein